MNVHSRYDAPLAAAEADRATSRRGAVEHLLAEDSAPLRVIGDSPAFRRVMDQLIRLAPSSVPVLIEGETGSGKEIAARVLHYLGPRRGHPFIPINCGAVPDALIETELFGHERGAFTDAKASRRGVVAHAEKGTLGLDFANPLRYLPERP